MRFDVLTLFPELIQSHLDFSIMKRAKEDGVIEINTINPRDYTLDKHKKVDDTPYGGGAGMLLACQPYIDAFNLIEKTENTKVILTDGNILQLEKHSILFKTNKLYGFLCADLDFTQCKLYKNIIYLQDYRLYGKNKHFKSNITVP